MIQLAEPPKDVAQGLPCPRCGCCHHYTKETRRRGTRIQRRRECRHCGHRFNSFEATGAEIGKMNKGNP